MGSMWGRAPNPGSRYSCPCSLFAFVVLASEGPKYFGKIVTVLINVGAPSAGLQPNGTENRSFAGVCLGYMLMPFVSKAVFGERPSKARSLDFMGYDSQAWHAWKFT